MKPDVSGILKMLFIWTFFFLSVCVFSLCLALLPASPPAFKIIVSPETKKKKKKKKGRLIKSEMSSLPKEVVCFALIERHRQPLAI